MNIIKLWLYTVEPWYNKFDSKQKIIYNYIDIACMYSITQITISIHSKVHSNEVWYDKLLDTISDFAWIPNSLYQGVVKTQVFV